MQQQPPQPPQPPPPPQLHQMQEQQQQEQEDDYYSVIKTYTKYRDSDEGKSQRANELLNFFVERMGYHKAYLGSSKDSSALVVIPVPEEDFGGGHGPSEFTVTCRICLELHGSKPMTLSNFFRHMRSSHLIDFRSKSACNNKAALNFVKQRFPKLLAPTPQESPYASLDNVSPQTATECAVSGQISTFLGQNSAVKIKDD